jgi:hypothetical protein
VESDEDLGGVGANRVSVAGTSAAAGELAQAEGFQSGGFGSEWKWGATVKFGSFRVQEVTHGMKIVLEMKIMRLLYATSVRIA